MYRVVILTLTGLFVVLLLATAPEFNQRAKASSNTALVGQSGVASSGLTYPATSDHLRNNAFRTIPVTAQQ